MQVNMVFRSRGNPAASIIYFICFNWTNSISSIFSCIPHYVASLLAKIVKKIWSLHWSQTVADPSSSSINRKSSRVATTNNTAVNLIINLTHSKDTTADNNGVSLPACLDQNLALNFMFRFMPGDERKA